MSVYTENKQLHHQTVQQRITITISNIQIIQQRVWSELHWYPILNLLQQLLGTHSTNSTHAE